MWLKKHRMEQNIQEHAFCSYHQVDLAVGSSLLTPYTKHIKQQANYTQRTGSETSEFQTKAEKGSLFGQ